LPELAADKFPPTRHSVICAVQSDDPGEKSWALEAITSSYWRPIYKHLRLRWQLDPADAQDLTQEFFARLIEGDFLAGYQPGKARLRTFLRTCADRLYLKQSRDAQRQKRGGGMPPLALDFAEAEQELGRISCPTADSIDQIFEREWLRSLLALALERLRRKCDLDGKGIYFSLFERYDITEPDDAKPTYADLARQFRISVSDVTNYLASARREFRECVLDKLREMTANDEEFQAEARSLMGASKT